MRSSAILGWSSVGLLLAVACGQSKGSSAETSAPPESSGGARMGDGGAAGSPASGGSSGGSAAGGRATGGRATGGAATGGARMGDGGAPMIDIPKGCRTSREFVGAGEWSVGYTCDGEEYSIHCQPLGDAAWDCGCRIEHASYTSTVRSYDVATESAELASSLTVLACAGDDPEFSGAPEICDFDESVAADSCRLDEICSRAQQVEGVNTVFKQVVESYRCQRESSGLGACSCGDATAKFPRVDWAKGCGFLRTYCESEKKEQVGTPSCVPLSEEASDSDCLTAATCEHTIELDDGASTTIVQNHAVRCQESPAARAACECSSNGSFRFDYPWAETQAETCSLALDLCLMKNEYERAGSYDCEASSRVVRQTDCETTLTCLQPATIGDTEVDLRGFLIIRCNEGVDSSACTCFSQNTSGRVESRAEISVDTADADEACVQVEAQCREAVDVVFADGL